MTAEIKEYLYVLECFSDEIKSEVSSVMRSWYPDEVPLTYLLGHVGGAVADVFPNLVEDDRRRLFNHIEQGMLSDDESFSTAIATGLIEGLIGRASRTDKLWEQIEPYLGDESRNYMMAWMNFGN